MREYKFLMDIEDEENFELSLDEMDDEEDMDQDEDDEEMGIVGEDDDVMEEENEY